MSEARSRLQSFLDAAEACQNPSQTTHLLATDSPEHELFNIQVANDDADELMVRYRDSNLGVVLRPEFLDDYIWVFGSDPHHETGVIGLPFNLPKHERPFVWTREKVLELLGVNGWQPVENDTGPLLLHHSSRRLQGRAFVHRVARSRVKGVCQDRDIIAPQGGPLFVHEGSGKKLHIGDQTVTVESAGVLNVADLDARERLEDEQRNVMLHIPEGTIVSITGPHHERRQLEVAGGAYEFQWLGTTMRSFPNTRNHREQPI